MVTGLGEMEVVSNVYMTYHLTYYICKKCMCAIFQLLRSRWRVKLNQTIDR